MGNCLLFTDIGGDDVDGAAVGIGMDGIAKMGVDLFARCQGIVGIGEAQGILVNRLGQMVDVVFRYRHDGIVPFFRFPPDPGARQIMAEIGPVLRREGEMEGLADQLQLADGLEDGRFDAGFPEDAVLVIADEAAVIAGR